MKWVKAFLYTGLIAALLAGCGTANNDRFTSDDNEPIGVRFNPQDNRDRDTADNMTDNDGLRDNNTTNVNNRNDNNGERNIDVADDVAEQVTSLKEVEDASVLVTDRNAYVAVKLKDRGANGLTKDVQDKIARKARDANQQFDNVYVSANPDFYDRMRGYGDEIRNGRPIGGFFDEFTETVQRVFPNAR
ncbi:YhcN/YlaJ family sporulation lipoprotein [Siminovitchia sediminis]|uniref:YhcN/YlaJ family sporulation lipoprotein n=1 Tax=Siminovitchia sediminis TaxID=1274353 RepID=A0ABW4KHJ5_9BACI